MSAKQFSAKPLRLYAMQLLVHTDPYSDNAKEIATWCNGSAVWNYNSEPDERSVLVSFSNQLDIFRVEDTDWVIRAIDGQFYMLTNKEFQVFFDTEDFAAPPTCHYCLSDPRYTPMGDPDEKTCPACGVRYSGPRRGKEYGFLVVSGLVSEEED
jgi:hypothetical protein